MEKVIKELTDRNTACQNEVKTLKGQLTELLETKENIIAQIESIKLRIATFNGGTQAFDLCLKALQPESTEVVV